MTDERGKSDDAITNEAFRQAWGLREDKEEPDHTDDEEDLYQRTVTNRALVGYVLAIVTICALFVLFWHAYESLNEIRVPELTEYLPFALAKFAAHAVITAALAFLGYQLLRAAERMILPWFWVRRPEIAALLLGLDHPMKAALRQLGEVANIAAKVKKGGEGE